jgi:methionine synthase I (cobalamin-dependent)
MMKQVHLDYIEAGANIIITASYQVPRYALFLLYVSMTFMNILTDTFDVPGYQSGV